MLRRRKWGESVTLYHELLSEYFERDALPGAGESWDSVYG